VKLVREHIILEKFKEDSDPVKDLNIGMTPKKLAEWFVYKYHGRVVEISKEYFGDKNHIGQSYVLWKFFRHIQTNTFENEKSYQTAFVVSCVSENYWGNRADIVNDRKEIAEVLKKHFDIEVDYLGYF